MALHQSKTLEYHIKKSENLFQKVKPNLLFDVNELLLDKNNALESLNFLDDEIEDRNTNDDDISDNQSNIVVISCRSTESFNQILRKNLVELHKKFLSV